MTNIRILVLVHNDAGQEARLAAAVALARLLDGDLVCLALARCPVPLQDYVSAEGMRIVWQQEVSDQQRSAQIVRDRLKCEGVRQLKWVESYGNLAEALKRRRSATDIFILNTALKSGELPEMTKTVADLALQTNRLFLLVPASVASFEGRGAALIAWDGSKPALAAVRRSLPVLRMAASVVIFSVGEGEPGHGSEKLIKMLAEEGIPATMERVQPGLLAPDFYIRERCRSGSFSYCVMGAYGHSRKLERWFGGVTQRMIARSEVPLFIAHR